MKILRTTPAQMAIPSQKRLGPGYSAHSLRVSFVTVAVLNGQSHKAIKNQTK